MATNQNRGVQAVGWLPTAPSGLATTLGLNAAATWLGMQFAPDQSKTLARASLYCSAVGGSLGASDVSLDIYGDAAGSPNASLASTTTLGSAIAANSRAVFGGAGTGLNLALTAQTPYWAVLKNLNGAPATNFPTFRYGSSGTAPLPWGNSGSYGWAKKHSTNSGGAWGTSIAASAGLMLEYTDGSFDGLPLTNVANTGDFVYSGRESGMKFTVPPNVTLNVRGVMFWMGIVGTPTGNPLFRLYTGSNTPGAGGALASTGQIPKANVVSNGYYTSYFAATQALTAGTTVRVTIAESAQSDGSSNVYRVNSGEYTVDTAASSLALLPFEGTPVKTYWDGTGPNWTDAAGSLFPFGLLLDTDGEFAGAGAIDIANVVSFPQYRTVGY